MDLLSYNNYLSTWKSLLQYGHRAGGSVSGSLCIAPTFHWTQLQYFVGSFAEYNVCKKKLYKIRVR